MILTHDRKTTVILPKDPTLRESFAAEELKKYLRDSMKIKALDADEIDVDGNNFLIGGPGRNCRSAGLISAEEFSENLTGPEGMYIEIRDNVILLAGSEGYDDQERGTLYAVYEFLERYLGCSFAAYSDPDADAGEIVPRHQSLFLPDSRYVKASADRFYRTAIVQYGEAAGNPHHQLNVPFFDWLCKNRYNRILTWASVYESYKAEGLCDELEKRGIRLSVGHHESSRMWLPYFGNARFPERYRETHPEYYRLNADGSRYLPRNEDDHTGQWIYCSRNEECIAEVSKNLIAWIGENPLVDTIAFWPNDGVWEQCSCEKCAPYKKVENYTYFLGKVAERVSTVYPDVKVDMLVYVDLWECPTGVKLPSCLRIDEATWAASGQRTFGKPDGSCVSGTDFEQNLMRWKDAGAEVVYYDYYMGVFPNRQRVIPMADEVQSIWKRFIELDIAGSGTQIECFNIWNHLCNLYTFGRTGYDTSLTFEDCLRAVCALYGEGGIFVAEAVRLMEEIMNGQEIIGCGGRYLMQHIDKERIYRLFDRALAMAKEPRERNNVRLSRMAFRYSDLEVNDPSNAARTAYSRFQDYDDPTGELGYMAAHFDSFYHNDPGFGIAMPVTNGQTVSFDGIWYRFE